MNIKLTGSMLSKFGILHALAYYANACKIPNANVASIINSVEKLGQPNRQTGRHPLQKKYNHWN